METSKRFVDPDDWMQFGAAARRLGVARNTVIHRCGLGQYRTELIGGIRMVNRSDVEQAAQEQELKAETAA